MKQIKSIVKYAILFLACYVFGKGELYGVGISVLLPYSVAIYFGLNFYVASIVFFTANFLCNIGYLSAISGSAAILIFFVADLILKRKKKDTDIMTTAICSLIALIPFCLVGVKENGFIIATIELIVNELTTFLGLIVANVFKMGRKTDSLSKAEQGAIGILLICFGISVGQIAIFRLSVFWAILAPLLIFIAYTYGKSGLFATFLIAFGVMLPEMKLMLLCEICMFFVLVIAANSIPEYLTLIIACALYSLYLFIFKESFFMLIPFSVGMLIYLIIPNSVKKEMALYLVSNEGKLAVRNIINRTRQELYSKISSLALVLDDLSVTLKDDIRPFRELRSCKNDFSEELANRFCHSCKNYDRCADNIHADTSIMLYKLVSASIEGGIIEKRDVPPFMKENCTRLQNIISASENLPKQYQDAQEQSIVIEATRTLLADQIEGLGGILKSLSKNVLKVVTFDENTEKKIVEGLGYQGIIVAEVVLYKDIEERLYCSMVVREEDGKKEIIRHLSSILNTNMILADNTIRQGRLIAMSFMSAPKYDVIFGEAWMSKDKTRCCGDVRSVLRITPDKFLMSICDGMGSGEKANKTGELTINLIESFFKAGISDNTAVQLINKMLLMRKGEDFAAVDIFVVDLENGNVNSIKLGGVESYIVKRAGIELVEGAALPIGILEEISPSVKCHTAVAGDILVLVSDGVYDVLDTVGIVGILENTREKNPEKLANYIVKEASKRGANDDLSVICAKLALKY